MKSEPSFNAHVSAESLDLMAELAGAGTTRGLQPATRPTRADGERALDGMPLSLEAAATLLRLSRGWLLEETIERAHSVTQELFGRSILLYAPCYLSSFCVNSCRYCGFNEAMPVPRRWLSPARALKEMRILALRGFRRVLMVAGEAPSIADPGYLAETLERVRHLVPELDLEVAPATEIQYREWRQAGAGGVVCFQETYDPTSYAELHPAGPKRDYGFRLGTLERAGRAGMQRLGLGVLLGLADPVPDLLHLIAHARYLNRLFPTAEIAVSLPRVRPAGPWFRPAWPVEDKDLLRIFAVLRLALPEAELVVSTREPEWLRQRLLSAGVTQMSVGCWSGAEAYVECPHDDGPQDMQDARTSYEMRWDLEDIGYNVRWSARKSA